MSALRRSRPSSAATSREGGGGGGGGRSSSSGSHLSHVSSALPPGSIALGGGGGLHSSPSAAALTSRPRSRDSEELTADVRSLKEDVNAVRLENAYLKTQLQRLLAQLKRKDKQIDQLSALKIAALQDAGGDAILSGQLRELRAEMSTIARLTDKFRDLESTLARRDDEIRRMKSSTKILHAAEAEMEAQLYYNEARRMKAGVTMLQKQLESMAQQLREAQGIKSKEELRYKRPASASPYNSHLSPTAAASAAARDHEMFTALRNEVAALRAENIRLKANSSDNNAHSNSSPRGGLHVLNSNSSSSSSGGGGKKPADENNGYASDSADYEQYESVPIGNGAQNDQEGSYSAADAYSSPQQQQQSQQTSNQQQQQQQPQQEEDDVPEQFEETVGL